MDLRLAGRRALVTGSTSGIGAEIAKQLAREGVRVVVHGRNADRAQAVAAEIGALGGHAATALGDLTKPEGRAAVVTVADAAFEGIDILVNSAGGNDASTEDDWFTATEEKWLDSYRLNTLPAMHLAQAFGPRMRERGWGRLIQISSRSAHSAYAEFGPHSAAKAALNSLTVSLSKAMAGTGVTSNGIMPGLISTPLAAPWFKRLAETQGSTDLKIGEQFAVKHLMHQTVGRIGRPEDIAAAACFIASPLADYMNGTIIRIDGGSTPTM
jgi:3-oxoacyl-[acyl-carrier protein] reductase